jgi:cellulose synthase/poly-beta-1,6-N-acetylglucosamine synthase-like glycosyltransferase
MLEPGTRPVGAARAEDKCDDLYSGRARRLGLPFVREFTLGAGTAVDLEAIHRGRFAKSAGPDGLAFAAPEEDALWAMAHWLARYPEARQRLHITTPQAIRAALISAGAEHFVLNAVNRLATLYPDMSARRVITRRQSFTAFFAAIAIAVTLGVATLPTAAVLHVIGAFFFLGVSVIRYIAAAFVSDRRGESVPTWAEEVDETLPVYTVLVPLLHEAHLVADLVAALRRIDWPSDRLDIKLLVEADDPMTIAAAKMWGNQPPFEVIVVPAGQPRTKPKALSFALPFARGDFVTVYDAEDQPHPQQLRAAYAVFMRSPVEIACLQATLAINNSAENLLTRLFAIEYAALFDGLLPALAAFDMPMPLGGTSNHFRREALVEAGGWDPFNVTEDADLGLRLARFGYRCATISLPTLEEAPETLDAWVRQRTRWFKGWMQTWLVHTRRPVRLIRELGWRRFLGFNLIGTGLIVSALIHPIYLATVLVMLTSPLDLWGDGSLIAAAMLGLNLFNLLIGYIAMIKLANRAFELRGKRPDAGALVALPIYWLLMSLASYRALFELVLRPHHWEKTSHRGRSARGESWSG